MYSLHLICLLPSEEQDQIINGPALAPPDGVTPNDQDPPNLNIVAEIITPILVAVVAILVLLRFCSRVVVQKSVHIEDVLCLFGFVSTTLLSSGPPTWNKELISGKGTYIGYVWCVYRTVEVLGLYVHQWNVSVQNVLDMLHIFQYFVNFYAVTILFMKAAILLEWMRIFAPNGSRGAFYTSCQVIFVVNMLFYISTPIAGNLTCRPFESMWNKRICGTCFDRTKMDIAVGAMNVASHLCILILPQGIIWKLQLPRHEKMGIAILFMFGILAVVCASFRLAVTVNYSFADDWTYAISPLALWCLAELTCLFIVFCVPSVPKAFHLFLSWSRNRSSPRSSNKATKRSLPWPSANSNPLKPISSEYQAINETGLPLQDLRSTDLPADSRDGKGILRTLEFSAMAEAREGQRPSYPHQYLEAWTGGTGNPQKTTGGNNDQAYRLA